MRSSVSPPARLLILATESFGGQGGIATYTRDLIEAYAAHYGSGSVSVVSRLAPTGRVEAPAGVRMLFPGQPGVQFALAVLREMTANRPTLIHCTHVNFSPLAAAVSRLFGVPWWLTLHGAEVWQPHRSVLVNRSASRADLYLPVSQLTLDRFRGAFPRARSRPARLLPPSVDLDRFSPGAPSGALRARLGLGNRRLITTVGRLSARERAKGFDRVIAALPALRRDFPDLAYVIAGSGDDAPRLARLAAEQGVEDRVFLTGFISEADKLDLYRSASAYVMPSTLEGFGIVFLEAMACGTPCVASTLDAGAEAVRDFGEAVDPFDSTALIAAIARAIGRERGVSPFIADYSRQYFQNRVGEIVDGGLSRAPAPNGELTS